MPAVYCQPNEVALFMRLRDDAGNRITSLADDSSGPPETTATDPPLELVVMLIENAQATLDRRTGKAWRTRRAQTETQHVSDGIMSLSRQRVLPIDTTQGDYVRIETGFGTFEGTADYALDTATGIIRFNQHTRSLVSVSYRYGLDESVDGYQPPDDVREATLKLVAIELLKSGYGDIHSGPDGSLSSEKQIELYAKDVDDFVGRADW